jgi:hypothetical protein
MGSKILSHVISFTESSSCKHFACLVQEAEMSSCVTLSNSLFISFFTSAIVNVLLCDLPFYLRPRQFCRTIVAVNRQLYDLMSFQVLN